MTAYVMLPANNTMRAEVFKKFDHWKQADAWIIERRREGDDREFFRWSQKQYDEAYDKYVAPYYQR